MFVCVCMCECTCIQTRMCLCIPGSVYACMYVYVCVSVPRVCVCVCLCVCVVHPGEVLASIISLPACRCFKLIHRRTAEQTDVNSVPRVNAKRVAFFRSHLGTAPALIPVPLHGLLATPLGGLPLSSQGLSTNKSWRRAALLFIVFVA